MPGRCTLTATSSPVSSVAMWTWAIEAAAAGSPSKWAKIWLSGLPNSDSTTARTTSKAQRAPVAQATELGNQLVGSTPSPDEMTWPSLM